MILYKYTGLEYIRSCIEKGIYASRLDNINDPFEGKGIRYKDQYRVVCLTSSPFQMLMWAYYGNHRGCCVEFDVDDNIGVRPVQYIKDFLDHEIMNTTEVIESLYKKEMNGITKKSIDWYTMHLKLKSIYGRSRVQMCFSMHV